MLGDLLIVQIGAPAYPVLLQVDVAVDHSHRVGQDAAAPVVIELVEDLVYKEVRGRGVEVRALNLSTIIEWASVAGVLDWSIWRLSAGRRNEQSPATG